MQPGVHYTQTSSCFAEEQLPWAFSSAMQKPYGVKGVGGQAESEPKCHYFQQSAASEMLLQRTSLELMLFK